jgi:hypothetical protein
LDLTGVFFLSDWRVFVCVQRFRYPYTHFVASLFHLQVLNTSFQTVAKTIRNMLAIVRDYAQKFPSDVGKRILQAANEVGLCVCVCLVW